MGRRQAVPDRPRVRPSRGAGNGGRRWAAGRVLVVIPCYNEEPTVAGLVLRAARHADEVLVVDDGSSDGTAATARLAGAVVLRHGRRAGKGAALRTGFRYAEANGYHAVVSLDGDGQHDPDEIPILLSALERGPGVVDMVMGARDGRAAGMPRHRRFGNRVLDVATAVSSGGRSIDSQGGFRAFGRRAIALLARRLDTDGFGVESETLVRAREENLRVVSVSVGVRYAGLRTSTKPAISHGVEVFNRVFTLLTMRRPLLTVGLPGLLLILLGAYWGLRMLQVYGATRVFVMSYALASATFAILGGILVATALMLNLLLLLRRDLPWGDRE